MIPARSRAAAVLLAAAAAAAAGPPPAAAQEPPADDAAVVSRLVEEASPLVEKARGLPFKAKVEAAPVSFEKFIDRYMVEFERLLGGAEKAAPASRLLARLGVLEEGTDVRAVIGRFLQGNIAANYDPVTGKVSFLPGAARSVQLMVHELTHALDDQHFDMKAQMASWKGHVDRMLAYGALAEGDAESVEYRFMTKGALANQPLEQLRTMADAMAAAVMQGKFGATPPALALAFKSQYLEGLLFAEALRRTPEGEKAIDAAFRAPPDSTEQILHPEKFLAREVPTAVALGAPPEGTRVLMETTLGELASRIVLLARGVEKGEAAAAAAGWAGDAAALLALPSGEALVWVTVWDTEADAAAFLEAAMKAFPELKGEGAPARTFVLRERRVEFAEAGLDGLPAALAAAKGAVATPPAAPGAPPPGGGTPTGK